MVQYNTIAETKNFIVLEDYTKYSVLNDTPAIYQAEAALDMSLSTTL
jgi:type I restriction enzyme, R subunit